MLEIKKYAVGYMESNCYVVWDTVTKDAVVIDPGYPDDRVDDCIKLNHLKVDKILLTHGHFDHIGGVAHLKDLTGAKVYIYETEKDSLTFPAENLSYMMGFEIALDPADVLMKHGDLIAVGSSMLKVIHTPGHTKGGVCFAGDGVIFTGDTLFEGSIGRTDFPGGNIDEMMASLKSLVPFADDVKVMPGHGADSTIGREKLRNPYMRRAKTL